MVRRNGNNDNRKRRVLVPSREKLLDTLRITLICTLPLFLAALWYFEFATGRSVSYELAALYTVTFYGLLKLFDYNIKE